MKSLSAAVAWVWFLSLAVGCSAEPAPKQPAKPLSAAGLAKLVAADKVDGKEDKVVSKCPACMLSMNGSAKHSTELEGYTVHSCHPSCAEALETDPEKVLARLP